MVQPGGGRAARPRRLWRLGVAAVLLLVPALLLLLRTPDTDPEAMRAKYAGPASRFLALAQGFSVHVRDEGPRDAPAILLLHGSNASLHTFAPWVPILSTRYRVVSVDLQGHGLTGPHPARCYSTACMAATVEAVRAALGLPRLVVAGNSMGGRVAIRYAADRPERVAAVALINSAGAPRPGDAPGGSSGRTPLGFRIATLPVLRELATLITPRWLIARSLESSVRVPQLAASPEAVDRYWELLRYPGNRQATLDRFATPTTPVSEAELAALGALPVLILWGADDPLFPAQAARRFARALPHAELALLAGIGHIPQEEAPQRSAAVLLRFLDRVPGYGQTAPNPAEAT